ncbi:alkaline phosphatase family protein [Aliikangiella sp. G2MR2-5]|uniref:alkaline phosphatase family protein n=1 Tax=Aliikangiella sp. G2MR2-5 TaxID=2788943 RepID=UPI0018AAD390|nr:alkaline phosphatase family protein [Aliikangiella sp. G2MR2-5]
MSRSKLSKVEHFVVLMLENRSFDQMLGYLYSDEGNKSPLGHSYEGLTGEEFNFDSKGNPINVYKISPQDDYAYFMPGADPGEGYFNTNSQLFSDHIAPSPITKATNEGFVKNFEYTLGWEKKSKWSILPGTEGKSIMGMFTPGMLPVLSTLARSYAVCDHWYCSAPTETLPNRAFLAMGTSQGRLTDKEKVYTAPTIFNLLSKNGKTWSIYGYDKAPLSRTSYADITHASNDHFGMFSDFKESAEKGKLANYVFLEPQWGKGGNSQHPNYDVAKGEELILEVYNTLRGSPLWEKTLLIITYDEHGGCYDHVAPPEDATPPDNTVGQYDFDFTRFGPRVPAVLVSPYIEAGTVYRVSAQETPIDHTSILKTIEERFGLPSLTQRDAVAPSLANVLTLDKVRDDNPLKDVKAPTSSHKVDFDDEPDHLQQLYVDSMNSLPYEEVAKKDESNKQVSFSNSSEAMDYAHRRYHDYFSWYEKHNR